jgi:hypothetical protein
MKPIFIGLLVLNASLFLVNMLQANYTFACLNAAGAAMMIAALVYKF